MGTIIFTNDVILHKELPYQCTSCEQTRRDKNVQHNI